MKSIPFIILSVLCYSTAWTQTQRQIDNLKAFGKAYGYIKYFHPSDEAYTTDWDKLSIYGVDAVKDCKNDQELQQTLEQIFQPIAPTIRFTTDESYRYNYNDLIPSSPNKYTKTYWQHIGDGYGTLWANTHQNPYKSIRINRTYTLSGEQSSFGNLLAKVDAKALTNKKIRYIGWVKNESQTGATGHLWIRVDNQDGSMGFFENMDSNPIRSKEWTRYVIEGTAGDNPKNILLGCFLKGNGILKVDDLQLQVFEFGTWQDIVLPNGGFETEEIAVKKKEKAHWAGRGTGFTFDRVEEDVHSGKKSAQISSKKTKVKSYKGKQMFPEKPKNNEVLKKQLGSNLYLHLPLELYTTKQNTYPKADEVILNGLTQNMRKHSTQEMNLNLRLGNIVNLYNVFQHFFPYFDEINVDWEQQFEDALKQSFADKSRTDHTQTLLKMTSKLNDGHIWINNGIRLTHRFPFDYELLENQLVVTHVYGDTLPFQKGAIITHIDGKTKDEYLKVFRNETSTPTQGHFASVVNSAFMYGKPNSSLMLTINGKNHTLKRTYNNNRNKPLTQQRPKFKRYPKGIVYLNLDRISMDSIYHHMPELEKSSAIICDMRGYPNGNHDFIRHLMKTNDTTSGWMKMPQIIYPDHESFTYQNLNWMLKTKRPYLGDKKVYFLMDGSAISYAESYLGYIEGYKLATLIGEPSAGTNGNINPVLLPGGYTVYWTGMKVVKHNGKQHFNVGITPDVYVTKTIEGVLNNKDEYLEKAFELIEKQ